MIGYFFAAVFLVITACICLALFGTGGSLLITGIRRDFLATKWWGGSMMFVSTGIAGYFVYGLMGSPLESVDHKARALMELPREAHVVSVDNDDSTAITFTLPSTRSTDEWLDILLQTNRPKLVEEGAKPEEFTVTREVNERTLHYHQDTLSVYYYSPSRQYHFYVVYDN